MRDPWLAAALLLALVLRVAGLGHGLPFVYNPDEVNIMSRALSVAQDPNPHYFLYPSFFFYLLFAVMAGLFVLGRMGGRYSDLEHFTARFFEDPTAFYLAGRAVGAVSALATIVLTYHLAERHFGKVVARAASFLLAVAYFHVRDAHYLKHDVPCGLVILLALAAFDRAMEKKTLRSYVASGMAMGLAFATHYYTIFLGPAFLLCHWVSSGFRKLGNLVIAGVVSAAAFFLLSPFVVLDLPMALEHMKANRQVVVDRSLESGMFFLPSLAEYLKFLAEQGFGYLLLGLVVVGWILMARRGKRLLVLWGAFPLFFFALISYTFFAGRYLNPIAPSLVVAGALTVGAIHDRWGKWASIAVVLVAGLQPLYHDIQIVRLFSGDDTRTVARRWVLEHVADGSAIALQSYSVPLPQSISSLRESLEANGALDELDRRGKFSYLVDVAKQEHPAYRLYFVGRGDEKNRIYYDYRDVVDSELEPLLSKGVRHFVLRYPPAGSPPEVAGFFEEVAAKGSLQARFSPFRKGEERLHPYMDNEDWPPSPMLADRGPLVEVWSLEDP